MRSAIRNGVASRGPEVTVSKTLPILTILIVTATGAAVVGQAPAGRGRGAAPAPIGVPREPLGEGPWVLDTAEQHKVRVSVVAKGLVNPWSMAWLPDGSILVTERPGRLRIIRNGVLDPQP